MTTTRPPAICKTVAFEKDAANVFFHILTRCNLSCRHCYINTAQHGTRTLPLDTIHAWLGELAQLHPGANLVFLGGEPTLHPELAAAVKSARRLSYGSVTVDTNGYLFHDILSRVSPGEVDYFSFSLDGASSQVNDPIRGKGSFDRCVDGIRRAVAAGFGTSLIYTVSRFNIDDLAKIVPLLKDLGIHRFFIQVIGLRGKSALPDADTLQLTRDEWTRVVPAVAERVARCGITVSYPTVYLERNEPFECAGLVAQNFFVFPNGRVYRCPLCEDFPIHGLKFENDRLVATPRINETDLFQLSIPEGCVMNKLIQPENLAYDSDGRPLYRVACCLLKVEKPAPESGHRIEAPESI
jgi:MoaA/NifB/PqqE/SkfB family radical SAM enzyme